MHIVAEMQCRPTTEKLFKKIFAMSVILMDYTFQTSSPFIDTVINELLRPCTHHSSMIACSSCSTVSNSHRNTFAASRLPTPRNLPGWNPTVCWRRGRKWYFRSDGFLVVWDGATMLQAQYVLLFSEYYNLFMHHTLCHKLCLKLLHLVRAFEKY